VVIHDASHRRARYGELALSAAKETPPRSPALKPKEKLGLVGKPTPRLDTRAKVRGEATFGIDVKLPGMWVARVVRCPVFGGKLKSFEAAEAKKVPGVREVIGLDHGVAVLADHFYAARVGSEALEVSWDEAGHGGLDSAGIGAELAKLASGGAVARSEGDVEGALKSAGARTLEAVYQLPYLAHATMEPLNATADVRPDRCEIWAPTQAQSGSQRTASKITGLPLDKIVLHTTFAGGGFGRKAQTDFVAEAVELSKRVKRPVQVIWTREDDMRGGWYRPVAFNRLTGALDKDGWPIAWRHQIASPSILEHLGRVGANGIDRTSVEGAANLPYAIPNLLVTYARPDLPIPRWFWRSVGSSIHAYVTECFLDELARLGKKDPLEVRRRLLTQNPRHRRVLDLAAEKAGWGTPLPAGRGRGLAVHESFGSIVAEVAEVSIVDRKVRVHRVVCAVDSGEVVNPSTVVAQMESGIVYGLSAALFGQITIDKGRTLEGNFDQYPVLRIEGMPVIETHLAPSGEKIGGIGEPGTPPIAPAVVNGLLALTGNPIRKLPIEPLGGVR
jgi:isoquinoline 1-oxidoreductase beta subunit